MIQDEGMVSSLIPGLVQRPPELGRIRLGEKSKQGYPLALKTFRLTSASRTTLEAAAALYGGKVTAWDGAPDEGMWQLVTAATELDVLIPGSLAVITQAYELWQGGTLERRCDGTTEAVSGQPCLCAAAGLQGGERECEILTRLRVMLPRIPGLGVWRLDTSGYLAATTLPSTVTLLARLTPGAWIPAVLRAEQRSKRDRDDKGKVITHRFVVPVLDLPGRTIGQIVELARPEAPQLEDGQRPAPATAADRAATRRAELEQMAGGASRSPGAEEGAESRPAAQGEATPCSVASPKGEPCEVGGTHSVHRNGRKSWPTPHVERPSSSDGETGQEEVAGSAAPATDLTGEARRVFEGEIVEQPAGVQTSLEVLRSYHDDQGNQPF